MNVSLTWLGTLVDIKGFKPEDMADMRRHSGRTCYSPGTWH